MDEAMTASDVVIGALAAGGVVVLIVVFIWVVKMVFVDNDTAFNESFAVFVEQEGLRQYLLHSSNLGFFDEDEKQIYQWYLSARKDRKLFRQLIKTTFEKLKILYASELLDAEKLVKKQVLFEQLQNSY